MTFQLTSVLTTRMAVMLRDTFNTFGSGELITEEIMFRCNIPPFLPPFLGIHDVVNKIQATIAIITAMIGLPLNIYLFILILKYKSLHQRSLFMSLQIIAIEIVYHAVVPATILTSGIKGTWIFGEVFCNITGIIHDAFAMVRFSMTLVVTVDRFVYIFKPFIYSEHGIKIAWFLCTCMWILSLIRVIIPLYGVLDCYSYIPTFKTCTAYAGCSKPCEYFVATSITFIVSTGVIIPMILYIVIFIKVKQVTRERAVIQNNNSENLQRNVQQSFIGLQQRKKILITGFLLIVSIAGGTTPAFTLYIISLFYRAPNATIFIVNMLIGRTFFNLIPVFDIVTFARQEDIRTHFTRPFKAK